MHGYPAYAPFARDCMDPEVVPYYAELMRSFSGKPVLFSEFGNPECAGEPSTFACLTEDEMAAYCTAVLTRLHERGAIGALWWCWADYDPSLRDLPPFDRAPHELHFGIVRADGTEKPVAGALARFARSAPRVQPAAPPQFDETRFFASLPGGLLANYHRYRS